MAAGADRPVFHHGRRDVPSGAQGPRERRIGELARPGEHQPEYSRNTVTLATVGATCGDVTSISTGWVTAGRGLVAVSFRIKGRDRPGGLSALAQVLLELLPELLELLGTRGVEGLAGLRVHGHEVHPVPRRRV